MVNSNTQEARDSQIVQFLRYFTAAAAKVGEVVKEEAAKSPIAKKVNESFQAFQKGVGTWASVSEKEYYNIIQPDYPLKG